VLILGTRLAGVDACVLAEHWLSSNPNTPGFTITLASKDGVLPMVRAPPKSGQLTELKYLNKTHIQGVID
jgi:uncharacterized NAD(P)/FAD-binding protein YdhS